MTVESVSIAQRLSLILSGIGVLGVHNKNFCENFLDFGDSRCVETLFPNVSESEDEIVSITSERTLIASLLYHYQQWVEGNIGAVDFSMNLLQRILSNCYIDLSDFSSSALSSIAVATATPHSSALQLKKSSCVNIAET